MKHAMGWQLFSVIIISLKSDSSKSEIITRTWIKSEGMTGAEIASASIKTSKLMKGNKPVFFVEIFDNLSDLLLH